ncbi:glutathione S-transferase [Vibrio sp. T187]|uniref:glutathione S-transferase family protein n=1 Tax=Vibrio TaxID=662 RepID=UPI0010C9832A|nr:MULTISPECIES: glutathione S-transferase [Vibrio]MBW3696183.1 glutathione S-transferase [Vibrio sp. T187]
MKLFEFKPSPSSRRVAIFLNEIGVELETVQVNVRKGENLSPAYQAISVNGKVPVLALDNGSSICESVAICRYLNDLHPNNLHLFGHSPTEKAKVEMWHRVVEFQGLYPAFQAFRNISGVYNDREVCITEWGYESKQRVKDFLPVLEDRLGESDFIAGDRYSIVDITAYVFIQFIEGVLFIDIEDKFPNISRWHRCLVNRPAYGY